ncbi:MAG: hypothetical protein ACYDDF_10580 [Thermoplasmatota archaeon]
MSTIVRLSIALGAIALVASMFAATPASAGIQLPPIPGTGPTCQSGIISPGNTNCCMVGEICLPYCVLDLPCTFWLNPCRDGLCNIIAPPTTSTPTSRFTPLVVPLLP